MKKFVGSLLMACILAAPMAAFAQDTMKKDDAAKKDEMKKEKKAKKKEAEEREEGREEREEGRDEERRQHEEAELVLRPRDRGADPLRPRRLFFISRQQLAECEVKIRERQPASAFRPPRRMPRNSICSPCRTRSRARPMPEFLQLKTIALRAR